MAVDPNIAYGLAGAALGGGIWQAVVNWRKAPAESEEITIRTMTQVIEEVKSERNYYAGIAAQLREEIGTQEERFNKQIAAKNQELHNAYGQIGELRGRVEKLETRLEGT